MISQREKGVTLYLAMLIMSAALATALFVSTVSVREFRIAKEVADSARAVYIADSVMENTLYKARVTKSINTAFTLSGTACLSFLSLNAPNTSCSVSASPSVSLGTIPGCPAAGDPSLKCTASNCTHITTKGSYGTTNRAMEIVYPNC